MHENVLMMFPFDGHAAGRCGESARVSAHVMREAIREGKRFPKRQTHRSTAMVYAFFLSSRKHSTLMGPKLALPSSLVGQ